MSLTLAQARKVAVKHKKEGLTSIESSRALKKLGYTGRHGGECSTATVLRLRRDGGAPKRAPATKAAAKKKKKKAWKSTATGKRKTKKK